jgi:hypothetical protein
MPKPGRNLPRKPTLVNLGEFKTERAIKEPIEENNMAVTTEIAPDIYRISTLIRRTICSSTIFW